MCVPYTLINRLSNAFGGVEKNTRNTWPSKIRTLLIFPNPMRYTFIHVRLKPKEIMVVLTEILLVVTLISRKVRK